MFSKGILVAIRMPIATGIPTGILVSKSAFFQTAENVRCPCLMLYYYRNYAASKGACLMGIIYYAHYILAKYYTYI